MRQLSMGRRVPAPGAMGVGQAIAPIGVGQSMLGANPACAFPQKIATAPFAIPAEAGGTFTLELTTPGYFCPSQLYLNFGDLDGQFITSIKVGTRDQIISGPVDARLFDQENPCCLVACLDCMCAPGVPMTITGSTTQPGPGIGNGTAIGGFSDMCPPNMVGSEVFRPPLPEGCPANEKIMGALVTLTGAAPTVTTSFTAPGKFCPRAIYMFVGFGGDITTLDEVLVTAIKTGITNSIVSGSGAPASLFDPISREACCEIGCLDCLCYPGVPLEITLSAPGLGAEESGTVSIVIVGSYVDGTC